MSDTTFSDAGDQSELEETNQQDPTRPLQNTLIAEPLLDRLDQGEQPLKQESGPEIQIKSAARQKNKPHRVVIDVNLNFYFGRRKAREWVVHVLNELISLHSDQHQQLNEYQDEINPQYVFATLTADTINELVKRDLADPKQIPVPTDSPKPTESQKRAIHRIWPDFEVSSLINRSISTVKADAARVSFMASGTGIVWAVIDSGIDRTHPHLSSSIHPTATFHRDFSVAQGETENPFQDDSGHGTHVAGIIAGSLQAEAGKKLFLFRKTSLDGISIHYEREEVDTISGMAPHCQLVSLKVLDADNRAKVNSSMGFSSGIIRALTHVQEINGYGRDIKIHGINLSLGYDFDPKWYACGQSPICVEVNRLVKSGVVVVVAAGNTGYGDASTEFNGLVKSGLPMSINDPGNADLAITVGSTHRDQPHTYGVSFFSSKGPTGDGRPKPDLVAPGERIISCASGRNRAAISRTDSSLSSDEAIYIEDSGTSMAAPHVSGAIASFLSIRREFIGVPETVKALFLQSATDLKRDPTYQGRGLIDLMRTIQAV